MIHLQLSRNKLRRVFFRRELCQCFLWITDPLCLSSSWALHFFRLLFLVHSIVNRDDRHLLAHATASDFSVAWQCLSKRTIDFLAKIHALIRLGVSPPSFDRVTVFNGGVLLLCENDSGTEGPRSNPYTVKKTYIHTYVFFATEPFSSIPTYFRMYLTLMFFYVRF
jgi:hypothetical protein